MTGMVRRRVQRWFRRRGWDSLSRETRRLSDEEVWTLWEAAEPTERGGLR